MDNERGLGPSAVPDQHAVQGPPQASGRITSLVGRIIIGCLVAVAVVFLVSSTGEGLGRLSQPGPGLWPLVAAVGTILVGVIVVVMGSPWRSGNSKDNYVGPLWLALTFAGTYLLLLVTNGLVALAFSSLMMTQVIGRSTWWKSVLVSLSVVAAIYLIFNVFLGVSPIN